MDGRLIPLITRIDCFPDYLWRAYRDERRGRGAKEAGRAATSGVVFCSMRDEDWRGSWGGPRRPLVRSRTLDSGVADDDQGGKASGGGRGQQLATAVCPGARQNPLVLVGAPRPRPPSPGPDRAPNDWPAESRGSAYITIS